MKYIFEKDGKKEEVPIERWVWGVVYKDGSELHQFTKDGKFHQMGEIDQAKAKIFVLYKIGEGEKIKKRIDIVVPDGAVLIHKYRRITFNFGTPEERKETIYIFGYKRTFWNHNKKEEKYHFNFVMPNDNIVQSDSDDLKVTEFGVLS